MWYCSRHTSVCCYNSRPSITLIIAVQNYNQTKHDHEIMLENQTQIQEVTDDDADMQKIPRMLYSVSPWLSIVTQQF